MGKTRGELQNVWWKSHKLDTDLNVSNEFRVFSTRKFIGKWTLQLSSFKPWNCGNKHAKKNQQLEGNLTRYGMLVKNMWYRSHQSEGHFFNSSCPKLRYKSSTLWIQVINLKSPPICIVWMQPKWGNLITRRSEGQLFFPQKYSSNNVDIHIFVQGTTCDSPTVSLTVDSLGPLRVSSPTTLEGEEVTFWST